MHAQLEQPVSLSDAVSLAEAARRWLPRARTGNFLHPSVLTRWSNPGIKDENGERVILSTWKIGGSRVTTKNAIDEFLAKLNAGTPVAEKQEADDSQRRAREAGKQLESLGC